MGTPLRHLAAVSVIAGFALAACSSGSDSPTGTAGPTSTEPGGGGGRRPRTLTTFEDCDSFLSYLKQQALDRVGPYGLDGMRAYTADGDVDFENAPPPNQGEASAAASDEGGPTYSTTNVQESGVDEADIVKTDGKRIVTINAGLLTVIDVTGAEPIVVGSLMLDETQTSEMFLVGDRVIVLSNTSVWGDFGPVPPAVPDVDPAGAVSTVSGPDGAVAEVVDPGGSSVVTTPTSSASITEIDLAADGGPAVVNKVTIDGQYLSARQIDDTIRLAISSSPTDLPWLYPQNRSGEQDALEANRKVIENSTLEDWIPNFQITGAAGDSSGQLVPCESLRHPTEFAGFDTVSVIDIDLAAGLAVPTSAVGVLASGQQVYSSLNRFYVASTQWLPPEVDPNDVNVVTDWSQDFETDVHAFALSQTEPTSYIGSGTVEGSLLNQFSMDEFNGNLRVVTTKGSPWAASVGDEPTSESILTVLAEQDGQLVTIGQVSGLGQGETLYSARFFDDVGFAVTFKQTDPLYVIDLADPTNPRVTGELKIPGVSTYLHPISETRILGIGQDADENGVTTGVKLSLFDVSDRANPKEISTWTLPNSSSPAEYDHRAFQMVGPTAIVPIQDFSGPSKFNGAIVFNIVDQIVEVGRVTNETDATTSSDCEPLDTSALSEAGRQTFEMAQEGGLYVQICRGDAVGGWGDDQCNRVAPSDLGAYYGPGNPDDVATDIAALGLGDRDRLELCFPVDDSSQTIQRSIVIDSSLYTVASKSLVGTDLATMTQTGRVEY